MSMDEQQLAQIRPSGTSPVSLYSPPGGSVTNTIIKTVVICNTTSTSTVVTIYMDNDGTTYDDTTALAFELPVTKGNYLVLEGFLAMNNSAGNLAVKVGNADTVTFTLFGSEIST